MTLKVFVSSVILSLAAAFLIVTHHMQAQEAPQRIEILAKRYDFTPNDITAKKGVPVTIVLTSKDADHGLKFDDFNFVMYGKKDETKEMTFTPDKAGTFIGQCSQFCGAGHGDMKLTLHVTE